MSGTPYTRQEMDALQRELRAGEPPVCPVCGAGMDRREVSPRPGVPYVRRRVWLTCRGCRRSAVIDRRRIDGR